MEFDQKTKLLGCLRDVKNPAQQYTFIFLFRKEQLAKERDVQKMTFDHPITTLQCKAKGPGKGQVSSKMALAGRDR